MTKFATLNRYFGQGFLFREDHIFPNGDVVIGNLCPGLLLLSFELRWRALELLAIYISREFLAPRPM
jgi:hypothetical protein